MVPMAENVGQYGFPHNSNLSGSGIAQIIIGVVLFMQMVACYKENRDHTFKKYVDYPVSETLMSLLPLNYKPEDLGGKVAWGSLIADGLIAALVVNAATAGKGAPSSAMAAKRTQSGMMALAGIVAITMLNKLTFSSKGADVVSQSSRDELASLLGCSAADVDEIVAKNEKMSNSLRYSIFTNMFVRIADAVTGSL